MSALTDLQASVDKIAADVDAAVASKADIAAKLAAAQAQVTDLTTQLAAFANDAQAMTDMKAKVDAADAKLIA
jgi:predicted  nucleic acid-binding Zn-ribbon protein